MCRAICAVYVESCEDHLYYRKHKGIARFYYENVSNVVEKRNPHQSKNRRRSRFCVWRTMYKDSEGSMLVSAHASSVYAV
jgi:hypothetical protein